jgi:HSP20 family protein
MGQGGSATAALSFIHHRKGGYQMVEKTDVSAAWPALFDPFRGFGTRLSDWLRPASDASSDDKAYRITLELPGVAEDDIHLTVANGTVSIRGEKKAGREEKGKDWYFTERQFGSFQRSFRMPGDADDKGVAADLRDGVLTVTIPRKAPPGADTRRIPVTRG